MEREVVLYLEKSPNTKPHKAHDVQEKAIKEESQYQTGIYIHLFWIEAEPTPH